MTAPDDVARSLRGAWLLARGDAGGMGLLDLTVDGFWRSFAAALAAALLAAPTYALVLADRAARTGAAPDAGLVGTVLTGTLAHVLDVATLPVLAVPLTRFLGVGARYVPWVVASNWASVPQAALVLAAVVLGVAAPPLRDGFLMAAFMVAFAYQWFVARVALGMKGTTALAVVLILLLVSAMLSRALDAVL